MPSCASLFAVARPMPLVAPVISAVTVLVVICIFLFVRRYVLRLAMLRRAWLVLSRMHFDRWPQRSRNLPQAVRDIDRVESAAIPVHGGLSIGGRDHLRVHGAQRRPWFDGLHILPLSARHIHERNACRHFPI